MHKKFKIIFCVLLRVNGLVSPVVLTQCTLRSKNTGYLPRAGRGRVNCIHENFPRIPGSAEPGTGSRRFKSSIWVNLNRQPLIASHCTILKIISVYCSRACDLNTIAHRETFQMLSNSGHGSIYACIYASLRSKNIEFRSLRFYAKSAKLRPPAFLILKQFFGLFVPRKWRIIVSTRLQKWSSTLSTLSKTEYRSEQYRVSLRDWTFS